MYFETIVSVQPFPVINFVAYYCSSDTQAVDNPSDYRHTRSLPT